MSLLFLILFSNLWAAPQCEESLAIQSETELWRRVYAHTQDTHFTSTNVSGTVKEFRETPIEDHGDLISNLTSDIVARYANHEKLRKALGHLTPYERLVLSYAYGDNWSARQIGRQIGVAPEEVEPLIERIKNKIRPYLID